MKGRCKNPFVQAAANIKRNNRKKAVGEIYELMWGEKPKRGRPRKTEQQ